MNEDIYIYDDDELLIWLGILENENGAGNESFERLASIGMVANFMVFLLTQYHMEQVMASNVLSIWSGVTNFATLIGAYISDAHLGRFTTIAYATFSSFLVRISIYISLFKLIIYTTN